MQPASRASRDVQLKRLLSHRQVSFLLLYSQNLVKSTRFSAVNIKYGARASSTSSSHVSAADYDLIDPEISHALRASAKTRPSLTSQPITRSSLVLESSAFQKWRNLLADPARLAIESDFFRQGAAKEWPNRLLVDMFKHHGDLALWTCLLDYQMRINGPSGVVHVWKGLWGRKALYDVHGPLAKMFWRVFLEGALTSNDPTILNEIWLYSEWMFDLHGVKWPHLYTTIMKHFLRTHQHQRILQWQLLLAPHFYPGSDEFANIIKEFVLDKELYLWDTLPSLYKLNRDKCLYNTLLPYLYNSGASRLARKWRCIFLRHREVPLAEAALKPFLRFLKAYHPNDKLTPHEIAMLESAAVPTKNEPDLSRETMNRVHGETFGISVKDYNDQLGAKWFASSWLSIDFAISTVSALGIEKIGPLSFQAIALRAENSEEVLNRVAQLREHGISVVDSSYFRLIIYLASQKDDELLKHLLHSDVHPDVFDDIDLLTRLIKSSADISNWQSLRLMLVARLVILRRSARDLANGVFRLRFQKRDQDGVSRTLEDMKVSQIPLNSEEVNHIFQSLLDDYNREGRELHTQFQMFYLTIFRHLASMDVPVPLTHWRLIIFNMARQGRLEDMGRLCIEFVDLFLEGAFLRPGFVPVHISDLPEGLTGPLSDSHDLLGVYIPQDLLGSVDQHPLRKLFNSKLLTAIVENAFISHSGRGFHASHGVSPRSHRTQATQIASVIKLLQVLKRRGAWLRVRKIRFLVTNCMVTIYGPTLPTDLSRQKMRAQNSLILADMKNLIDNAWGSELLQPLDVLGEIIQKRNPDVSLDTRVFNRSEEEREREEYKEEDGNERFSAEDVANARRGITTEF
ncbi:hypothetical protein GGS21DRAFT_495572 [Xylaria nigripes]|nr:hypothetical protein GGS21DRAFT_495572 [Xylaria nigripes]